MAASAIASGNVVAATGGVLFLLSDLLLGWNRFVGPAGGGHLGVMVTYHAAQLALGAYLRSSGPAVVRGPLPALLDVAERAQLGTHRRIGAGGERGRRSARRPPIERRTEGPALAPVRRALVLAGVPREIVQLDAVQRGCPDQLPSRRAQGHHVR